ncbi:cyclin-like protein [Paraphysoderma sedebokerense]|nr:cyclin-like protein [Paraphysoderma sedebokerense]
MRRVRRESLMASEYVEDIFAYLREAELKTMPDPNYMVQQKELQWNVRSILVDWIVAVHQKFHLLGETLFLTVNLIDRCLSVTPFGKHEVQLLGISCLFIACKYEEVIAPTVKNMEFMLDGAHNAEEILNAERFILKWLQYDLSYPGPYSFLRLISQVDNFDVEIRTLAKYFLEVLLMDERFLCVPPSAKAATGMYLAKQILQRGSWTPTHVHISGYTEAQLVPVCHALMETISKPAKYSAVYEKYNQAKYMGASQFVSEWYREVYSRQ